MSLAPGSLLIKCTLKEEFKTKIYLFFLHTEKQRIKKYLDANAKHSSPLHDEIK